MVISIYSNVMLSHEAVLIIMASASSPFSMLARSTTAAFCVDIPSCVGPVSGSVEEVPGELRVWCISILCVLSPMSASTNLLLAPVWYDLYVENIQKVSLRVCQTELALGNVDLPVCCNHTSTTYKHNIRLPTRYSTDRTDSVSCPGRTCSMVFFILNHF